MRQHSGEARAEPEGQPLETMGAPPPRPCTQSPNHWYLHLERLGGLLHVSVESDERFAGLPAGGDVPGVHEAEALVGFVDGRNPRFHHDWGVSIGGVRPQSPQTVASDPAAIKPAVLRNAPENSGQFREGSQRDGDWAGRQGDLCFAMVCVGRVLKGDEHVGID